MVEQRCLLAVANFSRTLILASGFKLPKQTPNKLRLGIILSEITGPFTLSQINRAITPEIVLI